MLPQRKIGRSLKEPLDDRKRTLGLAITTGQAKRPIAHVFATLEPLVRKAVDHRASRPATISQFNFPGENFTLAFFTLAQRIHAKFAQHEWLCIRDHLQAREVIL